MRCGASVSMANKGSRMRDRREGEISLSKCGGGSRSIDLRQFVVEDESKDHLSAGGRKLRVSWSGFVFKASKTNARPCWCYLRHRNLAHEKRVTRKTPKHVP
jgi:hypothetical protein